MGLEHFLNAFPEIADYAAEHCPRGCNHASAAEGCELDVWADSDQRRITIDSLRRLLASRAAGDAW